MHNVVKLDYITKGAPVINTALIVGKSNGIVCIEIDMKTKNCEVEAYTSGSDGKCGIIISTTEYTPTIGANNSLNAVTSIDFSEYKGWKVFATNAARYTISVCLIKEASHEALVWWSNISSLGKTQICDTNTDLIGSVRRWETLSEFEIE